MPSSRVPDSTTAAKPAGHARATQAERRTRRRDALLESAARGLSRYGYGNLVLEQVACDASLTRGARRRQPDRARRPADLRQLPEPDRVAPSADHRVVVNNADYLDWDAFAHAMTAHLSYPNGPHRNRRLAAGERKLLVAA